MRRRAWRSSSSAAACQRAYCCHPRFWIHKAETAKVVASRPAASSKRRGARKGIGRTASALIVAWAVEVGHGLGEPCKGGPAVVVALIWGDALAPALPRALGGTAPNTFHIRVALSGYRSSRSATPPCVARRRRCVKEAVPYALHTLPPTGAVRLDVGDLLAAVVDRQAGRRAGHCKGARAVRTSTRQPSASCRQSGVHRRQAEAALSRPGWLVCAA